MLEGGSRRGCSEFGSATNSDNEPASYVAISPKLVERLNRAMHPAKYNEAHHDRLTRTIVSHHLTSTYLVAEDAHHGVGGATALGGRDGSNGIKPRRL